MSFLINSSFFQGEINIPNPANQAILDRINLFIAKYEPDCLLKLLGYPLKKLVGIESSQRMTNLISGSEYTTKEGKLRKWQGLVHDTNISLIANYIYYNFQESSATLTTGVSTSVSKTEAGNSVSPVEKMVEAWNFLSSETDDLLSFLWNQNNIADGFPIYPEFYKHQFCLTREYFASINTFGI